MEDVGKQLAIKLAGPIGRLEKYLHALAQVFHIARHLQRGKSGALAGAILERGEIEGQNVVSIVPCPLIFL